MTLYVSAGIDYRMSSIEAERLKESTQKEVLEGILVFAHDKFQRHDQHAPIIPVKIY